MPSSSEINQFNEQWRASPLYAEGLRSIGANPSGPLRLTDAQRKQLQAFIEARTGMQFPKGTEVDASGNWNEDEGFSRHKKWIIPAAIGLGTLGLGAAGAGPLAGIMGTSGGASAAGGAAGTLAAGSIPTSLAMGAVPGIASTIGGGVAGAMGGLGGALAGGGGLLSSLGGAGGLLGRIGNVGSVLSGGARGSADQRLQESQGLLAQQGLAQQGARDQFSAGMQGAQFQREGQDRERKQAILMQLLNNTQDQRITPGNPNIAARMPTVTGGARPSNLTTNREALMALLGQPQVSAPTFTPPPPFRLPQAGRGESILGGLGLGASILGALGGLRR